MLYRTFTLLLHVLQFVPFKKKIVLILSCVQVSKLEYCEALKRQMFTTKVLSLKITLETNKPKINMIQLDKI